MQVHRTEGRGFLGRRFIGRRDADSSHEVRSGVSMAAYVTRPPLRKCQGNVKTSPVSLPCSSTSILCSPPFLLRPSSFLLRSVFSRSSAFDSTVRDFHRFILFTSRFSSSFHHRFRCPLSDLSRPSTRAFFRSNGSQFHPPSTSAFCPSSYPKDHP